MNKYLKLLLFTAVVALGTYLLKVAGMQNYLHPAISLVICFYFFQSLLIVWAEQRFAGAGNQNFVLFIIGSISFRLVTSLIVAVVYLVAFGEQNTVFIVNFFTLYLLFLGFELFTLMTNLRSNFEKRSN